MRSRRSFPRRVRPGRPLARGCLFMAVSTLGNVQSCGRRACRVATGGGDVKTSTNNDQKNLYFEPRLLARPNAQLSRPSAVCRPHEPLHASGPGVSDSGSLYGTMATGAHSPARNRRDRRARGSCASARPFRVARTRSGRPRLRLPSDLLSLALPVRRHRRRRQRAHLDQSHCPLDMAVGRG